MTPRSVSDHFRAFSLLLVDRFRHVRAQQSAASLAFTTLLSLVPLIAVSVGVASRFRVFDALGNALRGFLLDNLLPDKAGAVIAKYTIQFSQQANKLTAVGSVTLFIGSIVMLLTIDRAFNQIWQVARPRPLLSRLVVYWMVLTLGPLVLGGAWVGVTEIVSASLGLVDEPRWLQTGLSSVVPMLLLTGFLTLLYFAVPNRRVRFCHALIGGVAAAGGVLLMQRLFGLYLSQFGSYTLIYGAFSVVPVFLLWLYVCWVVILMGAVVAAILPEYQAGYRVIHRFPGRRYYGALLMLAELARAQREGGTRPLRVLANLSRVGIADTEFTLYAMRAAGWVEKTDNHQWLLACRLEDLSVQSVFERFAFRLSELPAPRGERDAGLVRALRDIHEEAQQGLQLPVAALLERAAASAADQAPSPASDSRG